MADHSHHSSHDHGGAPPAPASAPTSDAQRLGGNPIVGAPMPPEHTGHQQPPAAGPHDAHKAGAHVDHTGHEQRFRNRFWICLILSVPVLLYSAMLQMWLGFHPPAFPGSTFVAPLFATVIFFIGGIPFLQMARPELRMRQPIVVSGESDVVESMLTGESKPVKKSSGARVIAGAINGAGSLRVQVMATGEATALSGIMRLVAEAQNSKSRTQLLADRAARMLFYVALTVAGLTALIWTMLTGLDMATVERVVTVLVIACPHALGLAVPLVVAISTALGARNGILVRKRLALEEARQINTVVFDKTGTLTTGRQGLVAWESEPENEKEALLALAAAAEGDSEHIIARAIRDAARERQLAPPPATEFKAIQGRGVQVQVNGKAVYLGGPRLLELLQVAPPPGLERFSEAAGARGESVIYLVTDGQVRSAFAIADVIRPESKEAVRDLHAMGVEVAMLTGDSQAVAAAVARDLAIDTYFAEVLPEHKDAKVAQLQQGGRVVAMVGDGVNDAPALARANVGIAIGAGTDVAIESAGIILAESDPRAVVSTIALSHATYRKMVENLWWAAGYNIVALPLAAGVLAPWGIELSPAMGALLMSFSTIIVAINAQLLRRTPLRRT
ncbi:MAG: heavy metal translocating P-type ATPase [Anaerolineales bacterium]|nr:heavy metal translocating P-type ATPase [Anaerolineales bacterium]